MKSKSDKQDQIAMTKPLTDDEVRAEFEQRAAPLGLLLTRTDDGEYLSRETLWAWYGFRAGVKHGMERQRETDATALRDEARLRVEHADYAAAGGFHLAAAFLASQESGHAAIRREIPK